jgi:hypothetical protein
MSVNALNLANGADLLQALPQTPGAAPAAVKTDASTAALKTAKTEAQLNAASVLDLGSPATSPNVLNVYG